mmetsp:Transcript_13295/g.33907  ORF Transcript_13295/g.33907 Transcript_13295/m.33907 type:complete len:210 (+) Transcript_13295:261-890(+)
MAAEEAEITKVRQVERLDRAVHEAAQQDGSPVLQGVRNHARDCLRFAGKVGWRIREDGLRPRRNKAGGADVPNPDAGVGGAGEQHVLPISSPATNISNHVLVGLELPLQVSGDVPNLDLPVEGSCVEKVVYEGNLAHFVVVRGLAAERAHEDPALPVELPAAHDAVLAAGEDHPVADADRGYSGAMGCREGGIDGKVEDLRGSVGAKVV